MPHIAVNNALLHYEEAGEGPETIVFAHGVLFGGWMFNGLIEELRREYRCVTFDFRGHGGRGEPAPASGCDLETFTDDTEAVLRKVGRQDGRTDAGRRRIPPGTRRLGHPRRQQA
jgi:pimeloyl-ACP methyl ester carboxylesterase